MKKKVTIVILAAIVITFTGALYYLFQKNQQDPVVYTTETASKQTIVKKTVATGSIVPKEEVLINENMGIKFKKVGKEISTIIKSKTFQLSEKYPLGLRTDIFTMASTKNIMMKIV